MSKKSDKEDLKAVKAVETILKYCNNRTLYCDGCIFYDLKENSCMIDSPWGWMVEETIKFYKEDK